MSVHFLTGRPGNGKGLYAVKTAIDVLRNTEHPIITNVPFRIQPWIRIYKKKGKTVWQPEIGLKNYLLKTYGEDFNVERRLFLLDDDQTRNFFLYRVKDGVLTKATPVSEHGDVVSFDTSLHLSGGPVVYYIDEAWKFYGARDWKDTGKAVLYYAAQHRHFGDDFWVITQHSKQVDTALRQVAQDFMVVCNHGKRRIGMFKQPSVFVVSTYAEAPSGAKTDQPMSREVFKLDKKGIGGCYDTCAGVGIVGSGGADIGQKTKGLPWYLILIFLVVAGLTIVGVAKGFGYGAGKLLTNGFSGRKSPPTEHKAQSSVMNPVGAVGGVIDAMMVRPKREPRVIASGVLTNTIEAVSIVGTGVRSNGVIVFALSDGSILAGDDSSVAGYGLSWFSYKTNSTVRVTFK